MDARGPSWVMCIVLCVALLLAISGHSQGHAGCSHHHEEDHSEESWSSQGFSTLPDDGHDHGPDHHHHSHGKHPHSHHTHSHHQHGHDHKHRGDHSHSVGASGKIDRERKWRPAEEMAEERELKEFGFQEDPDDLDEGDDGPLGTLDVGLWLRAMGSSLAVSLASLICLMLIPFIPYGGGMPSRTFVDSLAAFGVGAMLGDAFLHQLPHAFGSGGHAHVHGDHEHDHGHEGHAHEHEHGAGGHHGHSLADLSVGISVLVGILLFFIVEKIVRAVEAESQKGKAVPFSAGHHHHHGSKHKHAKGEEEGKKDGAVPAEAKEEEEKGKGGGGEEDSNGSEEKDEVDDGFVLASAKGEDGKKGGKGKSKGLKQRKSAGAGDSQSLPVPAVEKDAEVAASDVTAAPAESASEGDKKRKKKNKKVKEEDPVGDAEPEAIIAKKSQKDQKAVKKEEATSNAVEGGGSSMMVLGYLNLFSDGVHNFTDGMSLGAAFLHHGTLGGYSRMLFMLAHELPQEVGDFGILLRAGFGIYRALAFNFLSALMAMAGTAFALLLGGDPGHSSIIEGFTAGGFIYIAVAGVMPDMHSTGTGLRVTLLQLLSMISGMAVAVGISLME